MHVERFDRNATIMGNANQAIEQHDRIDAAGNCGHQPLTGDHTTIETRLNRRQQGFRVFAL